MIRLIILGGDMLMLTAKQIRKWVRFCIVTIPFGTSKDFCEKNNMSSFGECYALLEPSLPTLAGMRLKTVQS
jgi:hypothetical protein